MVSDEDLPLSRNNIKQEPESEYEVNNADRPNSPSSNALSVNGNAAKVESMETETEAETNNVHNTVKPKLPELDKYWKTVNDDPTDFTGWTLLLQYVDQEVKHLIQKKIVQKTVAL